jgi:hypothetical protein
MEKNHKQEVMNYLTKTSQHVFERSVNDQKVYFKVFLEGEKAKYLEFSRYKGKYELKDIDIQYFLSKKGNGKFLLGDTLFPSNKSRAIRQNKFVKQEIQEILNNIK